MVDSENTYGGRVSRMVGWGHWFAFFNIIVSMLIGTRYISQSPWPETLLGQFYLAISWVGHFGFLAFALYLLVLFPLTFVIPSRKLFRLFSVCFATVALTVLLIDTQSYEAINLHLNSAVWEVLWNDTEGTSAAEWQKLFIVLPIIFLLQLALSEWVWNKQRKLSHKHIGRPLAAVFFLCFILSHLIYIWADAYFYSPITNQKANFPLSYPMTAKTFMEKHGLLDKEEYERRLLESESSVDLMNYPLEELKFNRRGKNLNLLVISANNLRADAVNEESMPFTTQLANDNVNFTNHYSSSNDSLGMFGLFYGLPSSYAGSIREQKASPVLFDVMKDQKYRFARFSGSGFNDPLYKETIFRKLPVNLSQDIKYNDQVAVDEWNTWLNGTKSSPWMSFIELTSVDDFTNYGDEDKALSASDNFKKAYYKAASSADTYIEQVFTKLQEKGLLESTIVIVTSNHGTEFNETKTNSWGTGTNYSRYQLQVPMIMHWPGKLATTYNHQTSHLDMPATLMRDLLGVSSKASDFSSGRNLLNESSRRWIIAGDSREIALITPTETTVIDRFGNFKLYDADYKRIKDGKPRLPVLMQGLTELKRFYVNEN
ncbi:DUF3413 domain-containing protein [Vibrio maerlii]|uniref:DUF3413 domain-containing protein n=1 Tax=Vibrio maerlii TaxID=2231648 RepID=UPI000E3EDAFA|nr:DUF3413 domain-containing protein [Vibrio maerlii]